MIRKIKKVLKEPRVAKEYISSRLIRPLKASLNKGRLPDYIIIGTQKGGTTSLQEYLEKHPSIASPIRKDVHFFSNNYEKGLLWYKKNFPNTKKTIGEDCPSYLYHILAAQRVAKHMPNVKIIVLLRNPVERAFSDYRMELNRNVENLSFEDAIKTESIRLKDDIKKAKKGIITEKFQYFSYIEKGKYADHIKSWLNNFDREQILVIKSEDMFSETQKVLNEVFSFLGVKRFRLKDIKVYNRGKKNKNLKEKIEKDLYKFFKPYNKRLYKILGRDFGWDNSLK